MDDTQKLPFPEKEIRGASILLKDSSKPNDPNSSAARTAYGKIEIVGGEGWIVISRDGKDTLRISFERVQAVVRSDFSSPPFECLADFEEFQIYP